MMASFMGALWGRRDTQQVSRDAIVGLRQQLQMIEKKQEHTQKKIDEELKKARANATSNKSVATAALKRKKMLESEMDTLEGSRSQLETYVNTLESAKMNQETMAAMKKAADALKHIHGNLNIGKVDDMMSQIQEQAQLANEVSEAISTGIINTDIDDEELKRELEDLEQDELNARLMEADRAPVHLPEGASRIEESKHRTAVSDEDAELRALQAELTMSG